MFPFGPPSVPGRIRSDTSLPQTAETIRNKTEKLAHARNHTQKGIQANDLEGDDLRFRLERHDSLGALSACLLFRFRFCGSNHLRVQLRQQHLLVIIEDRFQHPRVAAEMLEHPILVL